MNRILFVSHSAELNGAELWLLETLRGLDRSRFEPLLVLPGPGRFEAAARASGIETVSVPMVWWITEKARRWRQPAAWALNGRSAARLAGLIRKRAPGLVFSNSAAVAAGALAARRTGLPHVWAVHEMLVGPLAHLHHIRGERFLTSSVLHLSRRVIVNSKFCAGAFSASGRIAVIPNGSRPKLRDEAKAAAVRNRLGAAPGDPVLGVIGKLYAGKGQLEAVLAAGLLQAEFPWLRLAVIGEPRDAGYADAVRAAAETGGLRGRVVFEGWRADLDDWLAAMDVLLVPSAVESFGRAALDGMAAGTPVVAFAAGGLAEIVADGETGLLVPDREPATLAAAAARVLRDRALAGRLAAGGRGAVETRFSLDTQIRMVKDVLELCLEAGRP
ncbi:MAG: glycosyltransferase [Acidobacteriota bacterium]|nr:glycosyltransferase [Acidobacteriota bacterium]